MEKQQIILFVTSLYTMKLFNQLCFYLAIVGFLAMSVIHFVTYFGSALREEYPFLFVFEIIIVVPFVAAIFKLNKQKEIDLNKGVIIERNSMSALKYFMQDAPKFFVYVAMFMMVYCALIAIHVFLFHSGIPDIIDGKYVLHNHGHIIKELTKQEYMHEQAVGDRFFPAGMMYLYMLPIGVLWPKNETNL